MKDLVLIIHTPTRGQTELLINYLLDLHLIVKHLKHLLWTLNSIQELTITIKDYGIRTISKCRGMIYTRTSVTTTT